jgi:hypothetical protein
MLVIASLPAGFLLNQEYSLVISSNFLGADKYPLRTGYNVYKKLIFRLTDVTQIIDAKNLGHIIFCVSALYMFVVMLHTAESIFFFRFSDCIHMLIDERTSLASKCNPWPPRLWV